MYVSVSVPRRMASDGSHLIKFKIIACSLEQDWLFSPASSAFYFVSCFLYPMIFYSKSVIKKWDMTHPGDRHILNSFKEFIRRFCSGGKY